MMLAVWLSCTPTDSAPSKQGETVDDSSADSSTDDSTHSEAQDTSSESPAPCFTYSEPAQTGTVTDIALDEISDVVPSRQTPDLLWVLEDAANDALITAIDPTGSTLTTLTPLGYDQAPLAMVDWEDMAIGPCRATSDPWCLYIGDIGDNQVNRTFIRILEVPEPAITASALSVQATGYDFSYPDGAHNAEALIWTDAGPVVLTKSSNGETSLYRLDLATLTAQFLGNLNTTTDTSALTTAADLWPDGSRLLVRTYAQVLEYWLSSSGLDDLEHTIKIDLPRPDENQGESASYDPVLRGVWTISEGENPAIWFMGCSSEQ